MIGDRLDTETLVQTCRDGFDNGKLQERLSELQFTIQLRNKQLHIITQQLHTCRQENTIKVSHLQNQITQLKRQCADLRYTTVKSKRIQSQKMEWKMDQQRMEYQKTIQEQTQHHLKLCLELENKHRIEIRKLEDKYEQFIKLEKCQSQTYKGYCKDNQNIIEQAVRRLQEENGIISVGKRQAEQKADTYKQAYERMKKQHSNYVQAKEQQVIQLRGQIQGLKLQQKFLRDRLQEQKLKKENQLTGKKSALQQLRQRHTKLQIQLQRYKQLVTIKDQQILKTLKSSHLKTVPKAITAVQQCNHNSLLKQMERSLELKDKEILDLRQIVQQWTSAIGFDKPISRRLEDITLKSSNVKQLNTSFLKSLKQKRKQY